MRTRVDRIRDVLIGAWAVLAIVYLFIPIFVIALFSFNDNKGRFNFTWQGFTLRHWKDPFAVEGLSDAMVTSLSIAALCTVISITLGTFVALAIVRYRFVGRGATNTLVFLPLATPEVVLGAALLGWFLTMSFARGFTTVLIAHVMFTLGYVVITIRARLEGMDLHIEEAAQDLGANQMTTIRKVTLPLIAPGIVAAGLLAFAISIDDFVVSNFNAGQTVTFPLFVYGAARQGVPPQVNVMATMLLGLALVLMFVNLAIQRRAARRDAALGPRPARV
ncbi:MAG: ABC transporter permease [Solirubrobacteraceae bacterium]|nr:ABC transporter permease [Solirubrobacteraceae bacterium]